MIGTDRVRFCGQCNLNVYNLSSMTKTEAESLIAQTEGRLCVRFYRRTDGSILTRNCPIGLRAIQRRVSYIWKAVSAVVISFFAGLGLYRAITPAPQMGSMVQTLGELAWIEDNQGPDTIPHSEATVKVGEIIVLPYQNPAETRARRRKDKLRTGSTRQNR